MTEYSTLPLEIAYQHGIPIVRCIASPDCNERWALPTTVEGCGIRVFAAIFHVSQEHGGGLDRSSPPPPVSSYGHPTGSEPRP